MGGQYLSDAGGFGAVWIAAAISAGLASLLAVGVGETRSAQSVPGERPPLIYRPAVRPGFALFCGVAASAGFLAFAGLHADGLGLEQWSSVLFGYGAVIVDTRISLAKAIDRWPASIVAGAPTAAGVIACAVVLAIGVALLTPAIFAAIFSRVEPARRGAAAATASVFIDLGLSLGPVLMGIVVRQFGFPVGFGAAATPRARRGDDRARAPVVGESRVSHRGRRTFMDFGDRRPSSAAAPRTGWFGRPSCISGDLGCRRQDDLAPHRVPFPCKLPNYYLAPFVRAKWH